MMSEAKKDPALQVLCDKLNDAITAFYASPALLEEAVAEHGSETAGVVALVTDLVTQYQNENQSK